MDLNLAAVAPEAAITDPTVWHRLTLMGTRNTHPAAEEAAAGVGHAMPFTRMVSCSGPECAASTAAACAAMSLSPAGEIAVQCEQQTASAQVLPLQLVDVVPDSSCRLTPPQDNTLINSHIGIVGTAAVDQQTLPMRVSELQAADVGVAAPDPRPASCGVVLLPSCRAELRHKLRQQRLLLEVDEQQQGQCKALAGWSESVSNLQDMLAHTGQGEGTCRLVLQACAATAAQRLDLEQEPPASPSPVDHKPLPAPVGSPAAGVSGDSPARV